MDIEQKKKLGEFMEWRYHTCLNSFYYGDGNDDFYDEENWNPDTKHDQFSEVFERLEPHQKELIFKKFNAYNDPGNWTNALLHRLDKVMEAVLEVLNFKLEG